MTGGEAFQHANVAGGNASVGYQIGVLHGNAYIYQTGEHPTPEERFRVAVHYLQGGSPGEARRRIHALVTETGAGSAEMAYYWALSVLSGRALTNLDEEDMTTLDRAFEMAERHPSGRWWRCAAVLRQLVELLLDVGPDGHPDHHGLSEVLGRYDGLPDADRLEIERHLDLILTGMVQDHVEERNAEHVRVERMAGDRAVRVPKFFEPDPAVPVAKVACPASAESAWLSIAGGALLTLLGVAFVVQALFTVNAFAAVLVLLLLGAGGYAVVKHGLERSFRQSRRAAKEAEFTSGVRPAFTRPNGESLSPDFDESIGAMIDSAFAHRQPPDPQQRDAFWRDTRGPRIALRGDLVDLYGYRNVAPGSLRWLVYHHADDTARRWRAGTLDDFRRQIPFAATGPIFLGGLTALGAAAVLVLVTLAGVQLCTVAVAAVLLFFGVRFARRGGVVLYGDRRRMAVDTAEFTARWNTERAAHQQWVNWLADRPTDVEMGRWLDLDLSYWKRNVMRDYRLSNRDIFAHLALTEAAPGSMRARDVGGPFRHSAYTVLLFLLTEGGVRQVQARLDFATGAFTNERRTTFRYDAIASVRVNEVGVRYDNGQRRVVADDNAGVVLEKVVTHQAFELTLVNGQSVRVLVDNFTGELIDLLRENPENLTELAMAIAGVSSALRILEAIAADGRDWIELERQRLHRRLPHRRRVPTARPMSELPTTTSSAAAHDGATMNDRHPPRWDPQV